MLEAKCARCSKHAQVDNELSFVECNNCNYRDTYENYIETMKEKVEGMAFDYQHDRGQ
jgi:DNA-directed RNA polymerase subunit RPC12/RpoP